MTLLQVRDLNKSFGGVRAVDGINFDLHEGELLALIGPNGAGKSTTFNMVGGQLKASGGSIRLLGQELVGKRPRDICRLQVGRTFQIAETFASLTVVENVQMAKAYAMLVGIVGCLVGGAISAKLFKPKRSVVEHQADPAWRAQVLSELRAEFGDLGQLSDLPADTLAELHEMDLYALFADDERNILPDATAENGPRMTPVAVIRANGGRS